mmetsp:Transcript_1094/g.2502  ORF Transcript_1094/g.2502 Transcript_1094/m.2502 type:complete len:209 (-) Transcript_1094:188-814(-)
MSDLGQLANVPVLVHPPDGTLRALDRLVHRMAVLKPEAAAHKLAQFVLVEPMRRDAREGDPFRADRHRLQLVRLLPLAVGAVPHLPVGDALRRNGFAHGLVPAAVLAELVALADIPCAARRVPHHDVGHSNHLVDASLRHNAQLHAPILAELILQELVGRRAVNVHAGRGTHCNALDVAALPPYLLRRDPDTPSAGDLCRRRRVAFHL